MQQVTREDSTPIEIRDLHINDESVMHVEWEFASPQEIADNPGKWAVVDTYQTGAAPRATCVRIEDYNAYINVLLTTYD